MPAALAHAALFAATIFFKHYRDIEPRHGPDVSKPQPVGAQDFHLLQGGGQRGRDLHHAGVKVAGIGVDFAQKLDLHREGGVGHRVIGAVKPDVGATWTSGHGAPACAHGKPGGFRGAEERSL